MLYMKKRTITINEIINFLGKDILTVEGNYQDKSIDNLADVRHVTKSTLDWVKDGPESQRLVEASPATVMLVGLSVVYSEEIQRQGKVLIHVNKPKLALVKIGNHFFVDYEQPGIHPTAIVSPDAVLGKDIYIGPYCVIGAAMIGDNCVIDANVRIYDDVMMGEGCRIKSGAIIGGEGFGFEKDENGNRYRFPQIGGVKMGNRVEVGANTCIDRGALSDTVIGDDTKINNLCHIAHNNQIGKNVIITGCVNVSGSNVVDDNVWIAPNSSIRGYVHLGEKCMVGMGAVVTKDIPAGETWVGNPANPMKKLKDK